ncbi:MAG: hypothetical protein HC769_31970 [Cyanobacteria bacterium CRU_2_1]|nr:hypothetical protein [Cyanobacteria bacterium CRU_2_1]
MLESEAIAVFARFPGDSSYDSQRILASCRSVSGAGNLSPEEARHYQIAGILAECAARERGSTLLHDSMQQPDVLPQL